MPSTFSDTGHLSAGPMSSTETRCGTATRSSDILSLRAAAAESCSTDFLRQMLLSIAKRFHSPVSQANNRDAGQTRLKTLKEDSAGRRGVAVNPRHPYPRPGQSAGTLSIFADSEGSSPDRKYLSGSICSSRHGVGYAFTLRQDEIVSIADDGAYCDSAGIVARGLSERDRHRSSGSPSSSDHNR